MAEITKSLVEALSKVQGSLTTVQKDGKGNYGKYIKLDSIHEMVLPLLAEHGLAWVTLPGYEENGDPILNYSLKHVSGESIDGVMRLYISQPNSQQQGSAITYARRYAICAVVGIVGDEDDDGESAKSAPAKAYKPKEPVSSPTKAPEDPSRQVTDAAISNISKQKVREAFVKADIHGADVTGYCYDHIGKEAPTTESDAVKLLNALEVPF
jgi:hypothetical protein